MIFACTGSDVSSFESYEWVGEYETASFIYEGLNQPLGMVPFQSGFLVMDRGSSSLVYLEEGETALVAENILGNYFSEGERLLLGADEAIYQLDQAGEPAILLDGLVSPSAITQVNEQIFWLEEGELWSFDGSETIRIESDLRDPYDLIYWEDALWITTQGDKAIWRYDFENAPAKIIALDDQPHRFGHGDDGLWITTRGSRWPYAGWIVFFDGETAQQRSQTPPEPEWILFDEEQVIWASKQSITTYVEDPYDILAIQTRVGSMMVQDGSLYWTDSQMGKIGMLSLGN